MGVTTLHTGYSSPNYAYTVPGGSQVKNNRQACYREKCLRSIPTLHLDGRLASVRLLMPSSGQWAAIAIMGP